GQWNLFFQVPNQEKPVNRLSVRLITEDTCITLNRFSHGVPSHQWIYGGTLQLDPTTNPRVEFTGRNYSLKNQILLLDAIHLTPCYTDGYLYTQVTDIFNVQASLFDTLIVEIPLQNGGITPIFIDDVLLKTSSGLILRDIFPSLDPYDRDTLSLAWYSETETQILDTLMIQWNPGNQWIKIPIDIIMNKYFIIVDNDDKEGYLEEGTWYNSVTQAYGESSRYARLQDGPSAVHYFFNPKLSGLYSVCEMIPITENACDETDYILKVNNVKIDSVRLNQNRDYRDWREIFQAYFPKGSQVTLTVSQKNATSQYCLRADAAKIELIDDEYVSTEKQFMPSETTLDPIYPNPFNATVTIPFRLKEEGEVTLRVFAVTGQEVAKFSHVYPSPGKYTYIFQADHLSSGIYIVQFQSKSVQKSQKIVLIK
ncbi:MAG: T9SS type A sorting domain-containing protein, partial [Candidatus Marinimicrobia bacterium]|nr:T9SS type A sorting domain-containing protein [Candidatus Neomarinimicrobiota bacterium]